MPWAAAGAAAGAYISSEGAKGAAKSGAGAANAATAEERRQYNQTREDQMPWLEAGQTAVGRYQDKLGQQGDYERKIRSDLPLNYRSPTNVPEAYSSQAGDRFGRIKSDVQPDFQFGRQEFEQYKDPGYDFRKEEGLKALERGNAASGRRTSGYNTRSLMELGQNLASEEFGAARGRAKEDYQSGVNREQQRYGRSASDYGRRTSREAELYGRGRTQRQDETVREGELYQRNLRDYGLDVEREQNQYGRDISRYSRQYDDMMNREATLADMGQTTANNLGALGADSASRIGGYIQNAGAYRAAGQLGQAGAYADAIGALGNAYQNYNGGGDGITYDGPVSGDAYLPAYPGQGGGY